MNLGFRPARPADIARCVDIRGRTRQNPVSAARLAELGVTVASWSGQVERDELLGQLACVDGEIQGYCFGDTATGEIVVLALLPAHEAQGLGKALLQRVMAALQARGHRRLFLGCSADPASRSHGFYRHLGWLPTGATDGLGDEVLAYVLAEPDPVARYSPTPFDGDPP